MWRPPPDHGRSPALEPDAYLARHEALRAADVRGEILVVRREPETVVYKLCVLASDLRLESQGLLRQHERLERPMGLVQEDRGPRLVDLPRLDPDEPVFDHVNPSHAVLSREVVQLLHEINALDLRAVDRDRGALREADRELSGLRRRLVRIDRPLEDIARRGSPGVLEHAGLD